MTAIRELNEADVRNIFNTYMREAFPPAELKPLWAMLQLMARGQYRCFGYEPDGALAAYAFFYRHTDEVLLLDYFAVVPALRGRGVGSAFLAQLDDVLGDTCILGEVEAPDSPDAAANALRTRRIAFYERAGFALTGVSCLLYGVHYAIIARHLPAGYDVAQTRALLRAVYRGLLDPRKFDQVLTLE